MICEPVAAVDPDLFARLAADAAAVDCWVERPQAPGWWAAAVRSPTGRADDVAYAADFDAADVADTPLMTPAVAEMMTRFDRPGIARWMRLDEGGSVRPHVDPLPHRWLRFHVPTLVPAGHVVEFSGRPERLAVGWVWRFPSGRQHAVSNTGPGPRVALVVDARGITCDG